LTPKEAIQQVGYDRLGKILSFSFFFDSICAQMSHGKERGSRNLNSNKIRQTLIANGGSIMRCPFGPISLFVTMTSVALVLATSSAKEPAVDAKKLSQPARKNLLEVSPKTEVKPTPRHLQKPVTHGAAAPSTRAASITILHPTGTGPIVGSGNGSFARKVRKPGVETSTQSTGVGTVHGTLTGTIVGSSNGGGQTNRGSGIKPIPVTQTNRGSGIKPIPVTQTNPGSGIKPIPVTQTNPGSGIKPIPVTQTNPGPGIKPIPVTQTNPGSGIEPIPVTQNPPGSGIIIEPIPVHQNPPIPPVNPPIGTPNPPHHRPPMGNGNGSPVGTGVAYFGGSVPAGATAPSAGDSAVTTEVADGAASVMNVPAGATIKLDGSDFGAQQGRVSVVMGNLVLPTVVLSWSENAVSLTLPQVEMTGPGAAKFVVRRADGFVASETPFQLSAMSK
jgi:hypothetical protein